jgi:anti-sigma factor RsiW
VDACSACAEYFAQDRALLDTYAQLGQITAPLGVRQRVFDTLAQARLQERASPGRPPADGIRPSAWLYRASWPLMAATLAVLAWGWQGRAAGPPEGAQSGAVFVEDYLRRAVGEDHIVSSDPAEIQRFLARELGMKLGPIRAVGLELERAEICLLEGRRGAMIVYKKDGVTVSHYLVPRDDARPRDPRVSDSKGEDEGGALPVVTWSTPALEQALVGALDSRQLLALAEAGRG